MPVTGCEQRTGLKVHRCNTNSLSKEHFQSALCFLYFAVVEVIHYVGQQESNQLHFYVTWGGEF